eukprot:366178-Chlamydomonas_euryale.AAC.16
MSACARQHGRSPDADLPVAVGGRVLSGHHGQLKRPRQRTPQGIQGLSKLLNDNAPSCVKERPFEAFFGRKIAVDASCHLYAFLVAVGRVGDQVKLMRAMPCHAMPCHAMPCHAMPCNTSYLAHCAMPCHVMPRHAMLCHAMPCRAMPCHATPCHAMPRHAMPCHAMPCHAMPCHAMPCHAMPCHAMPCHAMPRHAMHGALNTVSCHNFAM